jgi:beta-glucosidase
MYKPLRSSALALAVALAFAAAVVPSPAAFAAQPSSKPLTDWPHVTSAFKKDAAIEARVAAILGKMTLAQKVGQMTQPEIKSATADDVRTYYLGSVLNGGGSWPNNDKHAKASDWLAMANAFYDASMATDMAVKVPVVWGTDAVHGHNNVYGATMFPHNIGLGAARDPKLVGEIGAATAKAVRATGIAWVFGPTLAVVRDDRWGRTYESYSEDPMLVASYAGVYVKGMQDQFRQDANTIATAKHFMGDGGTDQGKDRGVNKSTAADMMNIHAQGYYTALAAGAQTVMASFNSWDDVAAGKNYGKVHGSGGMLTDILKQKMGFDGFVVTDWNGNGEVPGCTAASCAQAINAGVDMVMVTDEWKAFIKNTMDDVQAGRIPMARIDDAVTRILRVKLRAGLFGKRPSQNAYAGKDDALQARELARRAVRESLVLLKNEGPALPLAPGKKILVVGKAADSMANQTGGWALTWQGTTNSNADFPNADTILAGIRAAAGSGNGNANVRYSLDGKDVNPADYDAVIAVIGEGPYAEGDGDIGPSGTLRHSSRYPEDLAVLQQVANKGKPVVTVFLSGRPLWVNDLMNLSDTFIAAWLPGTEGKGVSDLLVAAKGGKAYEFRGKLSFSWPKTVCQTPLNVGDANYAPLFAYGYGLKNGARSQLGKLDTSYPAGGCGVSSVYPLFGQSDRASFPLQVRSNASVQPLGADLNATVSLPGVKVETAQINTQQDAKLVTWTGPASLEAHGGANLVLPAAASKDAVLRVDTIVQSAPAGKVSIAMGATALDATRVFQRLAGKGKQAVKIPLACFTAKGADLAKLDTPFSVSSTGAFAAAFGNIDVVGGAAFDADAVRCEELQ